MQPSSPLHTTVHALMIEGKGILAADESVATAEKRLALAKLENTLENRRAFREGMFTAEDLDQYISGVILYDETLRDHTSSGIGFADLLIARGIVPGIKVDEGVTPFAGFPDEYITEGLDGLAVRMQEYAGLGARFAKWRAVFKVLPTPSREAITANAVILARYARIAQDLGIVPIVEPEVLYAGTHTIADAAHTTSLVLRELCNTLIQYRVDVSATILKTSMVLAGQDAPTQSTPQEVADATLRTLHLSVPHEMGGIVFLSGGQSPRQATENLNAIGAMGTAPWPISSSFSRALEEPFLRAWKGRGDELLDAQRALVARARYNAYARTGKYDSNTDTYPR